MSRQVAKNVRVVITRSKEGNSSLARRLRSYGMTPIPFNTLSFSPPRDWTPVDRWIENLRRLDWVIFTSAVGVNYFAQRIRRMRLSIKGNRGRPRVAAVGSKTEAALRRRKIGVDFVPTKYLTAVLGEELPEVFGRKVLLLRANIATPELGEILKKRGFEVNEAAVYETNYEGSAVHSNELLKADLVTFTSPSAVRGFCRSVPEETLAIMKREVPVVCIGPVTGRAAVENGFKVSPLPREHTIDGLIEEIRRSDAHA